MSRPLLRLGHSPDPDDAFMWWPLFEIDGTPPRLPSDRFRFEPVRDDIEALNARATTGDLEITAVSCAQYPRVRETYALTACGASVGEGYGPRLVARRPLAPADLHDPSLVVAVPGERTTAFAALSLLLGPGRFRHEAVAFDRIVDEIRSGRFEAGVVIHEGQLTFEDAGLHLVADLGAWWTGRTGLPLPLGANAVRRDLDDRHGPGTLAALAALLRRSIEYALEHRRESIDFALGFARGLDVALADRFVDLYVNRWTLDFGPTGHRALQRFLDEAHAAGLGPDPGRIDFIDAPAVERR
jgi:1,4-dihydroxy-6-naphthoate synthase